METKKNIKSIKEVKAKVSNEEKISLPTIVTKPKEAKTTTEILGNTQTQTFENKFLELLVVLLNQKVRDAGLEVPTTKLKGAKKKIFKVTFATLFSLLDCNPNEIESFLRIGKYIK